MKVRALADVVDGLVPRCGGRDSFCMVSQEGVTGQRARPGLVAEADAEGMFGGEHCDVLRDDPIARSATPVMLMRAWEAVGFERGQPSVSPHGACERSHGIPRIRRRQRIDVYLPQPRSRKGDMQRRRPTPKLRSAQSWHSSM